MNSKGKDLSLIGMPNELYKSDLYNIFLNHDDRLIHKWLHYFHVYEKHFERFRNQPIVLLEIGVANGGSLQMWKKYFGAQAKIIGIDINPATYFSEDQIYVRIGDQSNIEFLASIIEEFGMPDIIIDDGSHQQVHIKASFDYLYSQLKDKGVYFVEDLHTSYWPEFGGGLRNSQSFIEVSKHMIDLLNGYWFKSSENFANITRSMHFYDSCVAFEKAVNVIVRESWHSGKNTLKFSSVRGEVQKPRFELLKKAFQFLKNW